jgi:hypothetical protein
VSFLHLDYKHVVGFTVNALQSHILSAIVVQVKSLDHPLRVASIEVTKIRIDQFKATCSPLRNVWGLPLESSIYTVLDSSEGYEFTLQHYDGFKRRPVLLVKYNKSSFSWRFFGRPDNEVEVQASCTINPRE